MSFSLLYFYIDLISNALLSKLSSIQKSFSFCQSSSFSILDKISLIGILCIQSPFCIGDYFLTSSSSTSGIPTGERTLVVVGTGFGMSYLLGMFYENGLLNGLVFIGFFMKSFGYFGVSRMLINEEGNLLGGYLSLTESME